LAICFPPSLDNGKRDSGSDQSKEFRGIAREKNGVDPKVHAGVLGGFPLV
jgi:hypothetical protein